MKDAEYWIQKLDLKKHPEGGYFKETYRANEIVHREALPHRFYGDRSFSTAIYFLLPGNEKSAFHRIKSDELWHFYEGNALTIHIIDLEGKYHQVTLGKNSEAGQVFQTIVKTGCWFGAKTIIPESFSLVGCTVAPGFDFDDFEMGKKKELLSSYPEHQQIINDLALE